MLTSERNMFQREQYLCRSQIYVFFVYPLFINSRDPRNFLTADILTLVVSCDDFTINCSQKCQWYFINLCLVGIVFLDERAKQAISSYLEVTETMCLYMCVSSIANKCVNRFCSCLDAKHWRCFRK